MMTLNVGGALAPTVVHSLVDAFFEVKKSEMKQQVALELDQMRLQMDRAVENMFGGLVAQVKQLLIPVQQPEDGATASVVVSNDGHKSTRESATPPENDAVKPVPRPRDKGPNEDWNVKRAKDSIISSSEPAAKNRAVVGSLSSTEQKQIIKNSSATLIKNEPQHSVELPKATHNATISVPRPSVSVQEGINSCAITNTGDMVKNREESQSGDHEHQSGTKRPMKRQRAESSSTKKSRADRPETVSPASKFACETCGKNLCNSAVLKRHSRIHEGAKPYQCKWPDCSYASTNSGAIFRHIRELHFKQSRKNGADQGEDDPRDPKEFIQVDKQLLS